MDPFEGFFFGNNGGASGGDGEEGSNSSRNSPFPRAQQDQTRRSDLGPGQRGPVERRETEAPAEVERLAAKVTEAEESRKATQTELEGLLVVFSDLEAKRAADKAKLRELCQEGSDDGEETNEDEDELSSRRRARLLEIAGRQQESLE